MAFIAEHWPTATSAVVAGRPVLMFSGCNYLGLAQHPTVVAAAIRGLQRHGLAANGSPLTTGRVQIHAEVEMRLAAFMQLPAARLVPDGHLANLAACQGLAAAEQGERVALVDEAAHDSLVASARAAGWVVHRYRHADAAHAVQLCHELAGGAGLVMTDSVFGASGGLAPIAQLIAGLPQSAKLLVDDGHGLGVLGPDGRGAFAAWRATTAAEPHARIILTSSLSKGLGCYGGVIASDVPLIDSLRGHAGAYGGTTPIPPAIAEALLAAVTLLEQDTSRVTRLRENTARVHTALGALGQRVPALGVPIFCLTPAPSAVIALQASFSQRGIGVPLVSYANGPAQQYFRIAISAEHSDEDLDVLLAAVTTGLSP